MSEITIREIQPADNPFIANIVRTVLTEHGLNKPGTAFADKTLDELYTVYQAPRSVYYIAELDGSIAGGVGIAPLAGAGDTICELQKMYLLPEYRGKGIASKLLEKCLNYATEQNYDQCYLETMPQLKSALKMYEHFGFYYLEGPLGNTGHFTCEHWMLKDL